MIIHLSHVCRIEFLVVWIPSFLHCIFKVQILIEDLPGLKHRGDVLPKLSVLNLYDITT